MEYLKYKEMKGTIKMKYVIISFDTGEVSKTNELDSNWFDCGIVVIDNEKQLKTTDGINWEEIKVNTWNDSREDESEE